MHLRPYMGVMPQLGERVYVDPAAVVIGRVTLGDDASVWPCVVVRGDVNFIEIGARTNVQDGSILHVVSDSPARPGGLALRIGADVTIGHQAVVHAATIGSRCLIGMAAVITDGAVLEDEVIVGAGSVVAPGKRLASGGLYLGSPARRVRELLPADRDQILYLAAHYVALKDSYRSG